MPFSTRRRFMQGAVGLLAAYAMPTLAGTRRLTPRQTAGPFYPVEPPVDDDNDLAHVVGQEHPAKGRISDLSGRTLDPNGRPLRDIRIEIWQCDANGRYRHPLDTGGRSLDPGFQGFGHTVTDTQGRYRFRTIRPMPYPGRTPHIHVALFPPGERPFVTQLYVYGETRNAQDFLYNLVPGDQRHLVTAEFGPSPVEGADLAARWDIVLGVTPG